LLINNLIKGRVKMNDWEKCPKCGSVFIEWNSFCRCWYCLERKCHHKWTVWPEGPKTYNEIKNPYLRLSLPWQSPIPYVEEE
jgi:hypothetical protein